MGIPVIDDDCDSSSYDEDCTASCYHWASAAVTTATPGRKNATTNNKTTDKATLKTKLPKTNFNQQQQHHYKPPNTTTTTASRPTAAAKDLVGNNKEFRIECNKSDLRIIGNGNRIRIGQNAGQLQVIGNNTRLKISQNSGYIKYTGNDGRISLGSESAQQCVDYTGCNGILKIINSMELNVTRSSRRSSGKHPKKATSSSPSPGGKCQSDGEALPNGNADDDEDVDEQRRSTAQLKSTLLKRQQSNLVNLSLPNLHEPMEEALESCSRCSCKCSKSKSKSEKRTSGPNVNIVNNIGNIVIKNSVNVSIR